MILSKLLSFHDAVSFCATKMESYLSNTEKGFRNEEMCILSSSQAGYVRH